MKIEDLDWSVRTYHCIKFYGIDTVEQLAEMTDDKLMRIKGLGQKNLAEIRQKLKEIQMEKNKCEFCDDMDKMQEIVCYIPTANGNAVIVPVNFCPNCGKIIEW